MNRTELPRRPWPAVAPPVDGLDLVRREARRRRRRRTIALAASGAVAGVVAAAVLVSVGSPAVDVLRPVPPATHATPTPPPTTPTGHDRSRPVPSAPRTAPHRDLTGAPTAGPRRAFAPPVGSPHPADRAEPSTPVADQPEPRLVRSRSTYTGDARICGGSTYSDGRQLQTGVDWCLAAIARPTSRGVVLTVQMCRDSTSSGALTFTSSREVDLRVRRGGALVWSWAADHPGNPAEHQLRADANGCWNWSLTWPGITQSGKPAGHGRFTFIGISTAEQAKGEPREAASFTY